MPFAGVSRNPRGFHRALSIYSQNLSPLKPISVKSSSSFGEGVLTVSSISSKDAGAVRWWRLALGQQAHLHAQPPLPHLRGIVHVLCACCMLRVGTWAAAALMIRLFHQLAFGRRTYPYSFFSFLPLFTFFGVTPLLFFKKIVLSSNLQRAHISTPQSPGVLALKKWLLLKVFGSAFQPVKQSTVSS